jgi:hypothetical protein
MGVLLQNSTPRILQSVITAGKELDIEINDSPNLAM